MNQYQDAIICRLFRSPADDDQGQNQTYIGMALISWKPVVLRLQSEPGAPMASPSFRFKADLIKLFADKVKGSEKVAPRGSIEGRVQWIEHGHELSFYDQVGKLKDAVKEKMK